MGQPESNLDDDDLHAMLRKAVDQVRREPISEELIERCAARAVEIPNVGAAVVGDTAAGFETMTDGPRLWQRSAVGSLAASLLIAIALNALQIALDRPDPLRQEAAQLKTPDQQVYRIFSDLRLEPVS
jgi:hypothetical protein